MGLTLTLQSLCLVTYDVLLMLGHSGNKDSRGKSQQLSKKGDNKEESSTFKTLEMEY